MNQTFVVHGHNLPYSEFVRGLFKTFPDPAATLHHATTGMIGEAVEAMYARDRIHQLRELGDFEFYFEALRIYAPRRDPPSSSSPVYSSILGIPSHLEVLVAYSNDLLDMSKKGWAYRTPLHDLPFDDYFPPVDHVLLQLYSLLGTTREEVRALNVEKLRARYPAGTYSDVAAQQRADGDVGGAVLGDFNKKAERE